MARAVVSTDRSLLRPPATVKRNQVGERPRRPAVSGVDRRPHQREERRDGRSRSSSSLPGGRQPPEAPPNGLAERPGGPPVPSWEVEHPWTDPDPPAVSGRHELPGPKGSGLPDPTERRHARLDTPFQPAPTPGPEPRPVVGVPPAHDPQARREVPPPSGRSLGLTVGLVVWYRGNSV